MNVAPVRRRLGCLKTTLRQSRQQRLFRRLMATEATPDRTTAKTTIVPPPAPSFYGIPAKSKPTLRTGFAVYPGPSTTFAAGVTASSAAEAHPSVMADFHAWQIARMDPTGARARLFDRSNRDCARVGDVLMVTNRRGGEPFSGVCISIRRGGIDTAILLRGQVTKVGVEMWFKVFSRNVAGIEVIHRRRKRARRARLFYMRQPKHDMGSVEHLVKAWRKSRNILSTGKAASTPAQAGKGKGKAK